jgi:DNA-binding NarL/FixJ family response regulator
MRPLLYVVDDDAPMLAALVRALGRPENRFAFVGASNHPAGALCAVQCTRVDLVVSDWNMPDMDGIELTAEIKRASPATRVLLVTGYFDPEITRRALAAGADGILHKPFELPALRHCVRAALSGHRVLSDRATGHLLTAAAAAGARAAAAKAAWASPSLRQQRVLALLIGNCCLKEVAGQLGMSFHTADAHRRRAYRKLGVHTLPEATQKLTGAQPD